MNMKLGLRTTALALALTACAARPCFAADAPSSTPADAPAPATPRATSTWYGGEILLAELGSGALIGLGGLTQGSASSGLLTLGFLGHLASGPIVHGLHHASGGAIAGSILLRIGMPILGLLVGAAIGSHVSPSCPATSASSDDVTCDYGLDPIFDGIAYGLLAGTAVSIGIDAGALAWQSTADPSHAAATSKGLTLEPTVLLNREEGGRLVPRLGVAGTF
jgi:hypothetical protein